MIVAAEPFLEIKQDADRTFILIKGVHNMRLPAVVLVASAFCLLAVSDVQAHVTYVAYDPCCSPPVAVTAYYAPAPAVRYQPAAVVRTRWRPMFGSAVTRVRYVGSPAVYPAHWW